jgi:hypothetical protein
VTNRLRATVLVIAALGAAAGVWLGDWLWTAAS